MGETIVLQNVSKWFRRYPVDRPMTFKEAVLHGLRRLGPVERFWALRGVSFTVASGHTVGVIGPNGAGKSTLLRLIGGVGRPDEGQLMVHGRIGALLDLGAGFHPDLTGRENVFISGIISGLTRREVAQRFDAMVQFSELDAFIDNPLRTYSTGMRMRLAFAVAAHIEPEILLVDEVLAVGDLAFQRKCLERIARFKADGCTIVLVSHDMSSVQRLCDETLWLRQGGVVAYGPTEVVVGQYVAEMTAETRRRTPPAQPAIRTPSGAVLELNRNRFGSLEVELTAVNLTDPQGLPVTELDSGDPLRVGIEYLAPQPIRAPIFGVTISREDGLVCYDTSTTEMVSLAPTIEGRGQISFHIAHLDLIGAQYFVDVGVYEQQWAYAYDYHWHVYPLLVGPTKGEKGVFRPTSHWEIGNAGEGI